MKKISIVIPCYNEEKSISEMYHRIKVIFDNQLKQYDYEIIFVDDFSPDQTWEEIKNVCMIDPKVKGVKNAKNFGFTRNVFATLKYGTGDATFMLFGDLQDPPELLIQFVEKWEAGYKVILGQRTRGEENKLMYSMRSLYYMIIDKLSDTKQLKHFNGFGLYDKIFIDTMRELDDPQPYLKGIVAEFAVQQCVIPYQQKVSKRGKSGSNFMKNYDLAMLGITSYTKTLMRLATFAGALLGIVSAIFAAFVVINKILHWDTYPIGTASIIVGIFMLGAVQLFFIGILGEYILSINTRTMKRPLVVIGDKINFDEQKEKMM
ncbi:MAG: glycosyltransferase family 2 protein [Christensenellaceae bacterium]